MANIELPITKTKASHRPLPFRQAHSQLVKNMWCHPHSDPHYAQPELLYMLTHERVLRRHLLATIGRAPKPPGNYRNREASFVVIPPQVS
ncbi:hypothetical protein, partial [Klebsiella pneumoniae]|uniref:hypothetical protein n=1 Tax=Klebsiella pneumoniae TaxID=573 RepID=UPI003D367359